MPPGSGDHVGERDQTHFLKHRHKLFERLCRDLGVAHRGVPQGGVDRDAKAGDQRIEAVLFGLTIDDRRQKNGVEHRMVEAPPDPGFVTYEEPHVEGRVVCDQYRILGEPVEGPAGRLDPGCVADHLVRDAVHLCRGCGDVSFGVDKGLERFVRHDPGVDHPERGQLHDLVALGVEAGRLGVENDEDTVAQAVGAVGKRMGEGKVEHRLERG